MIAALFVERGGAYWDLPDVDPWDEARDARKYAGPWPVVAHPPCARWCRLAGFVESRTGKRRGDDGGCFASALVSVRKYGGVLEHPAWSDAFSAFSLTVPRPGGWQRTLCGGWVTCVEQGRYGHQTSKATWLYAFGVELLPSLNWLCGSADGGGSWLGLHSSDRTKKAKRNNLTKSIRSATPPAFRDVLLSIARSARKEGHDAV